MLKASAGTRSLKIRHFGDAQTAGELLRTPERIQDLMQFLDRGSFRQHHNNYHKAREGRALREDGVPFDTPLRTPSCGNWLWSLSASLVVGPQQLGVRQQHGSLGDAVECYLFTLYSAQTPSALTLVEDWATLATHLHELLHDVPPMIYYRLTWKQSWMTLAEVLDGWLCFDDPLSLEDGAVDHPTPLLGSRLRTSSTSGPKIGSRIADEGRSEWIVDSTPFEETGAALPARDPVLPEPELQKEVDRVATSALCAHHSAHIPQHIHQSANA